MFGLIKPGLCPLPNDQRRHYRRLYCGLCKGLGTHADTLSRLMVNHDTIVIATIVQAMVGEEGDRGKCRCPAMPVVHRAITQPDTTEMRVATGLQLLLAAGWFQDKAEDGNLLAKGMSPLARRWARQGKACLTEVGLDLESAFTRLMAEQRRVESQQHLNTPLAAAEPTAEFFASFIGTVTELTAVHEDFKTAHNRERLTQFGYELGMVIYLVDAVKDLEKDRARGHFNPCLDSSSAGASTIDLQRTRSCLERLNIAYSQLGEWVGQLPWQRHQALLNHLIRRRLGHTILKEVNTCLVRNGLTEERSLAEFQPIKGRNPGLDSCLPIQPAHFRNLSLSAAAAGTMTSMNSAWPWQDAGLSEVVTDAMASQIEELGDVAEEIIGELPNKKKQRSFCGDCCAEGGCDICLDCECCNCFSGKDGGCLDCCGDCSCGDCGCDCSC